MLTEVFDDENVGDVLKIAAAVVENLVGEVGASEGKPVLRSLELRLGLGCRADCADQRRRVFGLPRLHRDGVRHVGARCRYHLWYLRDR